MIKKYDELIVMYYVCTLVECWMSPAKYIMYMHLSQMHDSFTVPKGRNCKYRSYILMAIY